MRNFLVFCLVFLLFFGIASAGYDFDNTKDYYPNSKKVIIKNAYNIPLLSRDIAEIRLNTPLEYRVAPGYNKVAEFTIKANEDYPNALKLMNFYDTRNNMKKINRKFDYLAKKEVIVDVPKYIEDCETLPNQTIICQMVVAGTEKKTEVYWEKINKKDINEGEITIGIFTDVMLGDRIEWIPTLFGVEIDEWAIWTAELEVDIYSWYKMDGDNVTRAIDQLDNNSLFNFSSGVGQGEGIIKFSKTFDASSILQISSNKTFDFNEPYTFCFWANTTDSGNFRTIFHANVGAGDFLIRKTNTNVFEVQTSATVTGSTVINNGSFYHLCVTYNGFSTIGMWVNGVNEINGSGTDMGINTLFVGGQDPNAELWEGSIDEVGIWNRNLTHSEIVQLYNNGKGISYRETAVQVGLNSPANNSFLSGIITFNCTAISLNSTLDNITLYTNSTGSWSALNSTTGLTGNSHTQTWDNSFDDGNYFWSCEGCDVNGNCSFSTENRTIIVDSTSPLIIINSPSGILNYNYDGGNETLEIKITDTNLDTCWYNYNGTNITIDGCISGITNSTKFILEANKFNITVFANDSSGNERSETASWSYNIYQINQSYSLEAVETAVENFNTSVNFNSTLWNSISALVNYNGTNYSTTQSGSGNIINFFSEISIPSINESQQNNSFFWIFTLTNSTNTTIINSETFNQTVNEVLIKICDISENPYIIFDTKNAENPFPSLNATFKSAWTISIVGQDEEVTTFAYEDISELNNTWPFCVEPNNSNYTISTDVEVDATGFAKNFYYIQEAQYNSNNTENISLYLLNDSLASETVIEVNDIYQVPIQDALIFIQLYDIGTDEFFTIGMGKTDMNGNDVVYLNWIDSLYKFIIVKGGQTIYAEDPRKVFESPTKFRVEEDTVYDFQKFQDFEYTLFYNNQTQNFVLTYVKPSALVEEACLRVKKRSANQDTIICETCSESASATLFCNIAAYGNGTYIATFYATGSLSVIDWISEGVGIGFSQTIFDLLDDKDSAFYTYLIVGITVSLFAFNLVWGIIALLLGLLAASTLGFTVIEYGVYLGLCTIGGIIIWLIKR